MERFHEIKHDLSGNDQIPRAEVISPESKQAQNTEKSTTVSNLSQGEKVIPGKNEGVLPDSNKPSADSNVVEANKGNLDLKKTEAEKPKAKEEAVETEENAIELEKEHYEMLLRTVKKMLSVFKEREKNRLNALVNPDGIKPVEEAVNNIEKLLGDKKTDIGALGGEIAKITAFVKTIGTIRRHGGVREDTENLRDMINCLNGLETSSLNVVKQNMKDNPQEVKKAIGEPLSGLFNASKGARTYLLGLYRALESYHNKR